MVKKYDYTNYFFNDIYDDKLIQDKVNAWQNRLYHDILKGKGWYQNNRIVNGDITDVTIKPEINRYFGYPEGTYSLFLNVNIIPYYSEKAFFEKYGFKTSITSMDIIRDNKIFSKNLFFYINGYLIHDISLMVWKNKSIIFIPQTSDIKNDDIDTVITGEDDGNMDNSWTLMLTTKADYYLTTMARVNLFSGNKIYLSKFTEYKEYNKPSKSNCWTLYASGSGTSHNIMIGSPVTMEEDSEGRYFLVSNEFKELIYSKAYTLRCFIVNEPECDGCGIYVNTEDSTPIFQIPYKKNPIPQQNLIIWEYDSVTKRKLHPLVASVEIKYPNIFNFENMLDASFLVMLYTNSKELVYDSNNYVIVFDSSGDDKLHYDLYIEWIEPMTDISAFDSYIQDYMDYYQEDFARQTIQEQLPSVIKSYNPIEDLHETAQDYYKSEYYDDYRAWKLSRIIELLKDNPKRYDELFHMLYYNAKKYLTRCYTPEKDVHIFERSITDNRDHCDNFEESLVLFNNPQAYIRVYNYTDEKKPASLFIDGEFNLPKYVMHYNTSLYVYFPVEKIVEYPIQIDIELIDEDILSGNIQFNRSTSQVELSNLDFSRKVSLSDLLFSFVDDGSYVDINGIDIVAQVDVMKIQYIGSDEVDTIVNLASETILSDSEGNVIEPTDYNYIILASSTEPIIVEDKSSTKPINLDDISLVINDDYVNKSSLIRKGIRVSTTDFYQQKVYNMTSDDNGIYVFKEFKGKPSKSRFRAFLDGRRISPSEYSISFAGYNEDATFTFTRNNIGQLIIQYIGFDEELVYEGIISDLKKSNSDILYLSDALSTPFDTLTFKIFINGYRIADSRIKTLGQSNMIFIDKESSSHIIGDSGKITIYAQRHDQNMFEFDKDSQFLDSLTIENEEFRNYIIDKYTR